MKIVVLDGYTLNPGDLSWEGLEKLGDLTVYDRTSYDLSGQDKVVERVGDAEILFVNKTPVTKAALEQMPNLKFIGVLATGYNGSLPGQPHCEDVGCLIVENHCVRTNHAEINALVQAVTHGVTIKGSTAYITNMSCTTCAKALIASGIIRVVVFSDYHDTLATQFFSEAGIEVVKLPMPSKRINYDLKSFSSARKTAKSK